MIVQQQVVGSQLLVSIDTTCWPETALGRQQLTRSLTALHVVLKSDQTLSLTTITAMINYLYSLANYKLEVWFLLVIDGWPNKNGDFSSQVHFPEGTIIGHLSTCRCPSIIHHQQPFCAMNRPPINNHWPFSTTTKHELINHHYQFVNINENQPSLNQPLNHAWSSH